MFDFLTNEEFLPYRLLIVLGLVAVVSVVSVVLYYFGKRTARQATSLRKRFQKALLKGLKDNTIDSLDNVTSLYEGIAKRGTGEICHNYSISLWLSESLEKIANDNIISSTSHSSSQRNKWLQQVQYYLDELNIPEPFADLPKDERTCLTDIVAFAKNNDLDSVNRKLAMLGGLIRARLEYLRFNRKKSNWAIVIGIVGWLTSLYQIIWS
jgi:hypothetical protein